MVVNHPKELIGNAVIKGPLLGFSTKAEGGKGGFIKCLEAHLRVASALFPAWEGNLGASFHNEYPQYWGNLPVTMTPQHSAAVV